MQAFRARGSSRHGSVLVRQRGSSFAEAREDLLDEIDQLLGVLEDDERARLAPNMVERVPWIYRLLDASSDEQLIEILFAQPTAAAPAPALATV